MAITTFTGDLSGVFPAGTALEARPASNWPTHKRPPAAGTSPVGSAAASATSNGSGVAAFTGLADSTEYFVSDAAGTRYVRVTTYPERQEVMSNQANTANGYAKLDAAGKIDPTALMAGVHVHVRDKRWGGTFDGVTADTAAWQAAADYAKANGGGDVIQDGGVSVVGNVTLGSTSRVSFKGTNGAMVKAVAGNLSPIFGRGPSTTGQTEYIGFSGFIFQGDSAADTGLLGQQRSAIYLRGEAPIQQINVHDNVFIDFADAGCYLGEFRSARVQDNWFFNCGRVASGQNALSMIGSSTFGNSATWGEVIVTGNIVRTSATAGIVVTVSGAGYNTKIVCDDNLVIDCTGFGGIMMESNGSHRNGSISNNTVLGCLVGIGIVHTGGTEPTQANFRCWTVSGNEVESTLAGAIGFNIQSSNTHVEGNMACVTRTPLVFGGSTSGRRPVNLTFGPNTWIVSGAETGPAVLGQSADRVQWLGGQIAPDSGGGSYQYGMNLTDLPGLVLDLPLIQQAGRDGIRLTDCPDAILSLPKVFNPSTDTSNTYSGITVIGAAGATEIMRPTIKDNRGGSAKMKYAVDASGVTSGTVKFTGASLLGYVTAPYNGLANLVFDGWDDSMGQPGPVAPSARGWNHGPLLLVVNTVYCARLYARRDMLITNLRFQMTNAAANNLTVDVGIYDSTGNTKLASSGQTTGKVTGATGFKSVNLSTPYAMKAGTSYFLAMVVTDPSALGGALPTIGVASFGGNGLLMRGFGGQYDGGTIASGAVSNALPSNITSLATSANVAAAMMAAES